MKFLVDNNFNREVTEEVKQSRLVVLSAGLASGELYQLENFNNDFLPEVLADAETEARRFQNAVLAAKFALNDSKKRLQEKGLGDEAAIFDAHMMILEDSELINSVCNDILEHKLNAGYVYQQKMLRLAGEFRNLDDIYMKERSTDVLDVARQVLAQLSGADDIDTSSLGAVIISAHEVTPSMISKFRPGQLKGIITYRGSAFSHVAILARALGVPAIAGCRLPVNAVTGSKVIIDSHGPEIIINPGDKELDIFETKHRKWEDEKKQNLIDGTGPAITSDGIEIPIYGNIGDIPTAESVITHGAEGVGLVRTEFLYLNRREKPSEKEQIQVLKDIFSMLGPKPVVVRTIDIGGDKQAPWLPLKKEKNPYMGVRGVRLYNRESELFRGHLRAILIAGNKYDVRIVIPMISAVDEFLEVKNTLNNVHEELEALNTAHLWPVPLGIMVETPSAVMMAPELAAHADFFSIGTNDLCQYMMAAERGDGGMEKLLNPLQPAVLRAIKMAVDAAHDKSKSVCVCGEMAGDPLYALVLLGLGVDCLSMSAPMIGQVKRSIRASSHSEMKELARQAVSAASFA